MKLSFNDHALKCIAASQTPDREGRLLYKKESRSKYKERWFRLFGNLLFYYKTNEFGLIVGGEPVGVLVLVDHEAHFEEQYVDRPFVFSISFKSKNEDGSSVKHYFSGSSREHCLAWVDALTDVNYAALKSRLAVLRKRIELVTGCDPLLVYFDKMKQEKSSGNNKSSSMFYAPSAIASNPTGTAVSQGTYRNAYNATKNGNAASSSGGKLVTGNFSPFLLPPENRTGKDHSLKSLPVNNDSSNDFQVSRNNWETFN